MNGRETGVRLQGFFKVSARLLQPAFGRVQHAQVVVSLALIGVRLGDFFEDFNGAVGLALLGQHHRLHEAQLHVLGGRFARDRGQLQCLIELSSLNGFFDAIQRSRRLRLTQTRAQQKSRKAHGRPWPQD